MANTPAPASEGHRAPFYAWAYVRAVPVAKRLGYALAIHGSCARDLDLVAIPWTSRAAHPRALVDAFAEEFQGDFTGPGGEDGQEKPHGRRAWSISYGGGGFYIDLSVMPRTPVQGKV